MLEHPKPEQAAAKPNNPFCIVDKQRISDARADKPSRNANNNQHKPRDTL
jgi:hypothetical protein